MEGNQEAPTKRFFSSYYHNLKPFRPKVAAWRWPSVATTNAKEHSKKKNTMFKSQDAVKQLLKLSEVEMMEKLFQMELSKAVSVRPLYNSSN